MRRVVLFLMSLILSYLPFIFFLFKSTLNYKANKNKPNCQTFFEENKVS